MPPSHEPELTLRGVCLGAVITVVFMSANVYLGLKTGITFSSSIPAAVLSMGLLKLVGGGGTLENNIVQTQASAAGTLCNLNLVLPGLVLIHYWSDFPLWQTMSLCAVGGLLGVVFSVPLRRVMVVESELPFPEGVAAAEVLLAGHGQDASGTGLRQLGVGAVGAGVFGALTNGLKVLPDQIGGAIVAGHAVFRLEGGLSLALVGIGFLVRLGCCVALLIGIVVAWVIMVPILTSGIMTSDPRASAELVWAEKVRLTGAGLIAVAGLWTIAKLVRPVLAVVARGSPERARSAGQTPFVEGDIPIAWIALAAPILLVPLAALFWNFVGSEVALPAGVFVPALTFMTALLGFLMATACGYLAGLLGSSSSPISGIAILTVMLVAALELWILPSADCHEAQFVGALAMFTTAIIITASSIANDNLQDLKSGQIVGSTPWKQQVALAIGVVCGAVTVAPVLRLLFEAYGFPNALPRAGMNAHNALAAPQAALLAQITDGIVGHHLDWTMVAIGAALGVVFVFGEALARRRWGFTLPALSVGIGMYLPCAVVLTIAVGGIVGWLAERKAATADRPTRASMRRRGVLLASGFLVGESIVGIGVALSDVQQTKGDSLSLDVAGGFGTDFAGLLIFVGLVSLFYRAISNLSMRKTT